jgi:FkbM family methyltransferase
MISDLVSNAYRAYLQAPGHPAKLRVLRWLEHRLFPEHGRVFAVDHNLNILLHPRDYHEYELLRTGSYESSLLTFVEANLEIGDHVVMAGISFGMNPIVASKAVGPTGCVVAIDPHPKALLRARENMLLNRPTDNIRLVAAALGDESAVLALGDIPDDHIGWGSFVARPAGELPFYVQVETLPAIIRRLGIHRLDMMVLDVIGFELPVLKGFSPALLPKIITVAVHPWVVQKVETTLSEFQAMLESFGYTCRTLDGRVPAAVEDLVEHQLVGSLSWVEPRWLNL